MGEEEQGTSRAEQAVPRASERSQDWQVILGRVQNLHGFSDGRDESLSQRAVYGALGNSNGTATKGTLISYFRSDEASEFVEMTGCCLRRVESAKSSRYSMAIVVVVGKIGDGRDEAHPEAWKTESMTTGSKTVRSRK